MNVNDKASENWIPEIKFSVHYGFLISADMVKIWIGKNFWTLNI